MKLPALLFTVLAGIVVFDLDKPSALAKEQATPSFAKDVVPFLTKHCYACHGNGKKRGDVSLDRFRQEQDIQKDRPVWQNVIYMIQTGQMPPKERPRPAVPEIEAVLRSIEATLAKLDGAPTHNAGRVTLRRLNKAEYNNTIRDLVGIDFRPAADFPNDDVGYGFDNIGDVLSVSPLLLERYLAAADDILDRAIVIADRPKPTKNRLGFNPLSRVGGARRGVGTFLHSKGQISAQNYFEEGDYRIQVEVFGQQVGDEPVRGVWRVGRSFTKEFELKADQSAPVLLEANLRLKTGTSRVSVEFLNPYRDPKVADPDKQQRLLFVRSIVADGPYHSPPPVLPESHRRIMQLAEGKLRMADGLTWLRGQLPLIDHLPVLRSAIGTLQSALQREAARAIVTHFAGRAFRRPATPEEVERILKLYDRADQEGERFENRIRLALCRVLVSPHFLFRVELDPPNTLPGTIYPISEYELASRLSYFFWSSMPDEELLALAAKGSLRQNLEGQVRRMLQDRKAAAFATNFAGQWLTLRKLAYVSPDPKLFPSFDEELRLAMNRESELFFDAVLREDRSILDLIDADFSFVNERLAKHYGIEGIKGKEFRLVKLPANRGGILTQASILTLTSNSTRTSPVKRGKWVLDEILNTPPPPPPPDVPELSEEKQLTGSLRKVMEMHRANALCASCHQRMDPIGFAFENYNAIGAWRDTDGKFPIDPSGVLPDGQSFQGPAELKAILKGKKDLFSRCLTEKMLTYALGRGLEYYDRSAVDKIVGALQQNNYRFSTLLLEVVKSEPFQMRTALGLEKATVPLKREGQSPFPGRGAKR
jgi:hypothetical protein